MSPKINKSGFKSLKFFSIILFFEKKIDENKWNKVLKINSIYVTNIDGTNSADTTVQFYTGSGAYELAHTVPVPADSTLIVLGKDAPIYLEEGHSIRASASAAGDLQILISYEELDDA